MPGRVFTALLERAHEQYGYLTPADAHELGIDPTQLRVMAVRHIVEHLGRGLYRMPMVPHTDLDAYMEATLWAGSDAAVSHETALDLYDLCDVNPSAIHITVPRGYRTRKAMPPVYRLHREHLGDDEVRRHEGIPIVTPGRAILGGIEQALGWQLIDQAIERARGRGLIDRRAADELAARRHAAAGRRGD